MNLLYRRNIMDPYQSWLTGATMQSIVGAFGQTDGKAVINATNAYLNQLAASDRDKATALAGFINDTPALAAYVCGWLEPDEAYPIKATKNFSTGYTTKNNSWVKCISYCVGVPSGFKSIFVSGDYQKAYSFYCQTNGGNTFTLSRGTSGSYNFYIQGSTFGGKSYTIEGSQTKFKLSQGSNIINEREFYPWYGWPMNVYYSSDGWQWQAFQIGEGDTEVHRFLALPDGYVLDQINKNLITPSTP